MTDRITLERLDDRHLAELEALVRDPGVLRFTRVPDPAPDGFASIWLSRYQAGERNGTCAGFAAVTADGRFVGLGVAPTIDREGRELELGYVVVEHERGRGYAGELLRELTRWALDDLGAERIVLHVDTANEASLRVAERGGYTREGVLRSAYVKPGRRADTALYSLLRSDPRPV